MTRLDSVDPEAVLAGDATTLDPDLIRQLATHPLDCVQTEFPHWAREVTAPDDRIRPSEDPPVFYGCYDWHSAVHSHWNLVRQLRLVPDHPDEARIVERLDGRFRPESFEREAQYFEAHPTFEKPYGWGWLLRLAAELHRWDDRPGPRWRDAIRALEERIVALVEADFLAQVRPLRVGTHGNTAYGLGCVLDYARTVEDDRLETATTEAATRFFAQDRDAPVAYEPFGWDFLSPSLVEADLMRRVLPEREFRSWIDGFLPDVTVPPGDSILEPLAVDTAETGPLGHHYVGLNLSRAWCLADLAAALADYPLHEELHDGAIGHIDAAFDDALTDEYAGSHWLSSFVVYLLTRNEGGIQI